MKRGYVVSVAMQGDMGKPRPALIIQADAFPETATVTILPLTSELVDAPLLRIGLSPNQDNGLRQSSQVMVDKAVTIKREKIGQYIGRLAPAEILQVERALALFLGISG